MVAVATSWTDESCISNFLMFPPTILSLVVYIIYLITLLKYCNKELKSPFFHLNISVAFADISSLIVSKFFYKDPVFCGSFPLGQDFAFAYPKAIGRAIGFLFWYTFHAQLLGVVAITVNRFTAVVMPYKHNAIWSPRFLKSVIALMWICPVLVTIPGLTTVISLIPYFNDDGELVAYYYDYENPDIEPALFVMSALWIGVFLNGLLFILYLLQFVYFLKHRKTVGASNEQATNNGYKTEIKLALCGFLFFIVMSGLGLIFMMMIFQDSLFGGDCTPCVHMFSVVGDLFGWIHPYVVLLICSNARECFLKTASLGRCVKNQTNAYPPSGTFGPGTYARHRTSVIRSFVNEN